jgi:hypothetical protein
MQTSGTVLLDDALAKIEAPLTHIAFSQTKYKLWVWLSKMGQAQCDLLRLEKVVERGCVFGLLVYDVRRPGAQKYQ